MTSHEGLFLETGRSDEGRDLLLRVEGKLSEGMLANADDTGALEYHTADATLWFLHAVGRHIERAGEPRPRRGTCAEAARGRRRAPH